MTTEEGEEMKTCWPPRVTAADFEALAKVHAEIEKIGRDTEALRRELGLEEPPKPEPLAPYGKAPRLVGEG